MHVSWKAAEAIPLGFQQFQLTMHFEERGREEEGGEMGLCG